MKNKFLGLSLVFLFASCATNQKNMRAPELTTALSLRGKSPSEVRAVLGEPSDRQGDVRYFYFLQEESSHHPNPQPKLYQFVFSNQRLVKVESAEETHH